MWTIRVVLAKLCNIRGVSWCTDEYALLRRLGRSHIFSGDNVGARNNLRQWLRVVPRTVWSLLYFHLMLDSPSLLEYAL